MSTATCLRWSPEPESVTCESSFPRAATGDPQTPLLDGSDVLPAFKPPEQKSWTRSSAWSPLRGPSAGLPGSACDVTALRRSRSSPCPLDQSLRRSIQEDQFGVKLFFQFQLARFPHLQEQDRHDQPSGGAGGGGACLLLHPTRKMSVHSLRMRSTQGSSSNMMEWLIPLKNSLTNFPITRTTEAYNPIILPPRRREAGRE